MIKKLLSTTVLFSSLVVITAQATELELAEEFYTDKVDHVERLRMNKILSNVRSEELPEYKAEIHRAKSVLTEPLINDESICDLMDAIVRIPHESLALVMGPVVNNFRELGRHARHLATTIRTSNRLVQNIEKGPYYLRYIDAWRQLNSNSKTFTEFSDVTDLSPDQVLHITNKVLEVMNINPSTTYDCWLSSSINKRLIEMVKNAGLAYFDQYLDEAVNMATYILDPSKEQPTVVLQALTEVLPENLSSVVSQSIAEIGKKKVSGNEFFVSDVILEVNEQFGQR